MMFIRKAFAATVTVTTLAFSLTGCSSNKTSNQASTPSSDGVTMLELWYSSSGASGKLLESIVEDFNKANKGKYEVKATYQGSYSDAISKLAASVQTGDVPILMQASDVQTTYLIDSQLAEPMGKLLGDKAKKIENDLAPLVKNYYTVKGQLWSMPMFVSLPTLYANEDLLNKANVDPNAITSLDDLLDAVGIIKQKTGTPGLVYHQTPWFAEQFAAAAGINWCNPDNGVGEQRATSLNLTDPAAMKVWKKIQSLYQEGAILNTGPKGDDALGAFTSGAAAMQLTSSGALKNIEEAKTFPLSVVPLPANSEDGGVVPGGNSLWVLKEGHTDGELEGAAAFAEYIASDAVQKRTIVESGYLPTTLSGAQAATGLTKAQSELVDNLDSAKATTVTAGCHMGALNEVRKDVADSMQSIAKGENPEEAFASIQSKTNDAIKRYSSRAGK